MVKQAIKIGGYVADKGTVVVNGLSLNNGYGDGKFDAYLVDTDELFSSGSDGVIDTKLPDGDEVRIHLVPNVWLDLRDFALIVYKSDCVSDESLIHYQSWDAQELSDLMEIEVSAVRFGFDYEGNLFVLRYF